MSDYVDHSEKLMQALMAKLYKTITGNNENIKIPRNKFVSWFLPGVPFKHDDFKFCEIGFAGETAEEVNKLYHQAFVTSKLFDYVPETNGITDNVLQQNIFATSQDSISSVYSDILKYSRVLAQKISEKEKEKIKKFRNLLTETKEVKNIVTDEVETKTVPGKLTVAYNLKMNEYLDAANEYMNLLIDAQAATGDSPEAKRRVHEFANKAKFLRKQVDAKYMAWIGQGYKNEYEQINAYIAQVTEKSMELYKEDLKNKFNYAKLTSPQDAGLDFYYTTLLPGNFATSEGWTNFSFYQMDYESHSEKKHKEWGVKAGFLGIFSIGGSAGGSKVEQHDEMKTNNFSATFEFTQIPICRPWFEPGFFSMRAWTLDDLWNLNFPGKVVSTGEVPPTNETGRMIAYPISALFVRNVHFKYDEAESQSDFIKKEIKAGGSFGWGPFKIGGSYASGSEKRDQNFESSGGEIIIKGLQLIGTINNLVPKCPNLNPEIKPEELVGGS